MAAAGSAADPEKAENHQALASGTASSDKPVESLKNMNVQTAKHASWVVRVLAPKLVEYSFAAKGKQVHASKFTCLLVSNDPKQFMIGSVPFSFAEPQGAKQAAERFKEGFCFRIRQPDFDTKFKTEYISTSVKRVLLLTKPTIIQNTPPTDTETLTSLAHHVDLDMTLTQVIERLSKTAHQALLVNVAGKIQSLGSQKNILSAGRTRQVSAMELIDGEGSVVEVSVWDEAHQHMSRLLQGEGVTIVGCSVQRDADRIKLSLWESAHVLKGGPIAQSLTRLDPQGLQHRKLTAVYAPSGPLLPLSSLGLPTCAAALSTAPRLEQECIIQVNRCIIDVPTREDLIFTQDRQRLYSTCKLRDWSGAVDVDLVSEAMLYLYGLSSQDEVVRALADQTLSVNLTRVNARGVLRPTASGVKILIGMVQESPQDAVVSAKAMRDMLGFADVTGDIVLAAPASRVQDVSGLALETGEGRYISAHRVLLLVKGTVPSELSPIGDSGQSLTAQSFRVSSKKTRCLLSEGEVFVNLYGYCDFKTMLQYRLDKDTALVLASAAQIDSTTGEKTFIIEHISKVQQVNTLKESLQQEWRTVLLNEKASESEQFASPQKAEYWERSVKRLRRMESEPAP